MNLPSLEELLIHELQDLYDAEKKIAKVLPKMAEAAASNDLRTAFENHKKQTDAQIERLETVLKELDVKPGGVKCEAIDGIIKEGSQFLKAEGDPSVRDAALICAAQRVEHYEIASYGCCVTFAKRLGYDDAAELLHQTLEEERDTDQELTDIAESHINEEAAAAS